jgi:C-terminal processing protease CtpA/Prc
MNELCFSATDIFLAGLKGWRNITLVGTPSGGGSARIEAARLSSVPISLRLGSMVSYMPSGQLFDGNGVQPDVLVEPSPEFLIGGADNVLAQAIDTIRGRSKPAPPAPNP